MLSNFLFSKPKNVGNACEQRSLISIYSGYCSAMSCISRPKQVKYRPTIGEVSAKCRQSVGKVSAKCRRSVSEVSVNEKLYRPRHIWNDYRPCLDRVSTDYRPTIDRYIDRVSTECRPSIDRLSTDCRPTIDRVSTDCRPTVDRLSTAISADITHSKQDPTLLGLGCNHGGRDLFWTV